MDELDRDGVWAVVREERARLVEDLAPIGPEGFGRPSQCPGWDVHDVLAHLVDTALTTRRGFVAQMVRSRFDFDRANARGVARHRRPTGHETLESMRRVVDLRRTPPAPLASRLVEAVVHGEDVRRPLGIVPRYPVAAVVDALRYQVRTSVGLGGAREHVADVRLRAGDVELTHGDAGADEVAGNALDLLMLVSGRAVADEAVEGAGLATLRRRVGA
ncbi:maleylpyruvate isomerase family mycothiol-dependent enzyme [Solicola sp. PLA-1-18]|uniref:maleylpyruvate isomerase family mycothiol-dependent enzyme n=1 Tax=Solicola sp. PLA-1-18 TaxID=3380532 RepID=UPI003B791DE3